MIVFYCILFIYVLQIAYVAQKLFIPEQSELTPYKNPKEFYIDLIPFAPMALAIKGKVQALGT